VGVYGDYEKLRTAWLGLLALRNIRESVVVLTTKYVFRHRVQNAENGKGPEKSK
jgi:hypothetical protein